MSVPCWTAGLPHRSFILFALHSLHPHFSPAWAQLGLQTGLFYQVEYSSTEYRVRYRIFFPPSLHRVSKNGPYGFVGSGKVESDWLALLLLSKPHQQMTSARYQKTIYYSSGWPYRHTYIMAVLFLFFSSISISLHEYLIQDI